MENRLAEPCKENYRYFLRRSMSFSINGSSIPFWIKHEKTNAMRQESNPPCSPYRQPSAMHQPSFMWGCVIWGLSSAELTVYVREETCVYVLFFIFLNVSLQNFGCQWSQDWMPMLRGEYSRGLWVKRTRKMMADSLHIHFQTRSSSKLSKYHVVYVIPKEVLI